MNRKSFYKCIVTLYLIVLGMGGVRAATVEDLRCNSMINPMGVEDRNPRLSWRIISEKRGFSQTAFRILAASSKAMLAEGRADLWDSGVIRSDQSIEVEYKGLPLNARASCFWKVQVWDQDGRPVAWSEVACWEAGLPDPSDWRGAEWIQLKDDNRASDLSRRNLLKAAKPDLPATPPFTVADVDKSVVAGTGQSYPSGLFRKDFQVKPDLVKARAYICGLGLYELYMNGCKADDRVLAPGQTHYDKRAFYNTYDITAHMRAGNNAVGIMLGSGFYGQNHAFSAKHLNYGNMLLLGLIVLEYAGGQVDFIKTDGNWRSETGPLLYDNIYGGETYDAWLERKGWTMPGYDDSHWQRPLTVSSPTLSLVSEQIPPIRPVASWLPVKKQKTGRNTWIFDFGKNFAGWVKIKPKEASGTMINIYHAEVLTEDGSQLDMGSAGIYATYLPQQNLYICNGEKDEEWSPRFAVAGFRYVEVVGLSEAPDPDFIRAIEVRTDPERTGTFISSDSLLNKIYQVSLNTLEANMHSVPEDCPHREKCAWLGDAHAMVDFSNYNYDLLNFWKKFMDDIESTLDMDGSVSRRTPGIPASVAVGKRLGGDARPDWGVAVVFVPWSLYQFYGDSRPLEEHYPLMKRWVMHVESMKEDGVVKKGYGDFAAPTHDSVYLSDTPTALSVTALHYWSLKIMESVATLLHKTEDAVRFRGMSHATKEAFIQTFYDAGRGSYGSQTGNVLALEYGLFHEGDSLALVNSLISEIEDRHNGHFSYGIFGGKYFYTILDRVGQGRLAYDVMTVEGYPGYKYYLDRGLTTWPERPKNPDLFELGKWGSLNHPMHTGFSAWFHEGLGGIRPLSPGFKTIELRLNHAQQVKEGCATYLSPYGHIESRWDNQAGMLKWNVSVPANTKAIIYIPAGANGKVREGNKSIRKSHGVMLLHKTGDVHVYELLSGAYAFSIIPDNRADDNR